MKREEGKRLVYLYSAFGPAQKGTDGGPARLLSRPLDC